MLHTTWKSASWFWRRRFLKGFYHILAWRLPWSCDPYATNKISFPLPKKAPHKIWLCSAKRFPRRCSNEHCGRQTDDGRRTLDDDERLTMGIL